MKLFPSTSKTALSVMTFLSLLSNFGFAADPIWDNLKREEKAFKDSATFETVQKAIPLAVNKALVTESLVDGKSVKFEITGQNDKDPANAGYIVIDEKGIRSYPSLSAALSQDSKAEYTFEFEACDHPQLNASPIVAGSELDGVSIALDVLTAHQYYNGKTFGNYEYKDFVVKIQNALRTALLAKQADVIILRPEISGFDVKNIAEFNKNPPHLIVSPQFNNDNEDSMITFFSGHHMKGELSAERFRARLIHSLVTQKAIRSAQLASLISAKVHERLGTDLISGHEFYFENSSQGVSASLPVVQENPHSLGKVSKSEQNYVDGIAGRNLIFNGILAQAVVTPFPTVQAVWDLIQGENGMNVDHWIETYTQAICDAIVELRTQNPSIFQITYDKSL